MLMIVGESPSQPRLEPFLAELMDLPLETVREQRFLTNLLEGSVTGWTDSTQRLARLCAANFLEGAWRSEGVLILCGHRVLEAFALTCLSWCETMSAGEGKTIAALPYPCKENRWYDDSKNRTRAEALLQWALEQTGYGRTFH